MLINLFLVWMLSFSALFTADQPVFKGGQKNLYSFIVNNMIYPDYARQNCLQGTINVRFKLTRKGRVFDSEVQNGFGIDLDQEALRLVRLSSGKWIVPASHDPTIALVLPVNFSLKDYNCEKRTKDELNAALLAYHSRQALTKAIYNFYEKRDQNIVDQNDELKIMALKAQLGYDEKYIDRLFRQAQRKLKQGDKESACDDFRTIHYLGSDKADKLNAENCK